MFADNIFKYIFMNDEMQPWVDVHVFWQPMGGLGIHIFW